MVNNTEVHRLVGGAPGETRDGGLIDARVQEDTVLDLTPLGIDGDAAVGHRGEVVGLLTQFIDIPTIEDKAGMSVSSVRTVGSIGRDVSAIDDIRNGSYLSLDKIIIVKTFSVAVIIGTIHKVDSEQLTGVVEFDCVVVGVVQFDASI